MDVHEEDYRLENRIEPSLEADPLLDDINSRNEVDIDEDFLESDFASDRDYHDIMRVIMHL